MFTAAGISTIQQTAVSLARHGPTWPQRQNAPRQPFLQPVAPRPPGGSENASAATATTHAASTMPPSLRKPFDGFHALSRSCQYSRRPERSSSPWVKQSVFHGVRLTALTTVPVGTPLRDESGNPMMVRGIERRTRFRPGSGRDASAEAPPGVSYAVQRGERPIDENYSELVV